MIETERLFLRRWRPSDFIPFQKLNADPAVMQYFVKPLTPVESDAVIARCEDHFEKNGYALRPHILYRMRQDEFVATLKF